MTIQTDLIRILEEYRDKTHDGNAVRTANALGVTAPALSRWLNGVHIPRLETLTPVFDKLQARIVLPNDNAVTGGAKLLSKDKRIDELEFKIKSLELESTKLHKQVCMLKCQIEYSLMLEAARSGNFPSAKMNTSPSDDANFLDKTDE